MKKIDTAYLEDMLDAINKLDLFVAGLSFENFERDDKSQFAVFHALEVIGEAANKLSADFIKNKA